MRGPTGNIFNRPRFPVNLHQGLYNLRVDYTLARGPLIGAGHNWEQFQSAQVRSQLAPRSVQPESRLHSIAGNNWEQFQSAQVPSQLAPRSVQPESRLHSSAGNNWEQFQSAQVPSQLAPRSVQPESRLGATGPIGSNFSRPRFPVNLHQDLYNPRVEIGSNWSNWL